MIAVIWTAVKAQYYRVNDFILLHWIYVEPLTQHAEVANSATSFNTCAGVPALLCMFAAKILIGDGVSLFKLICSLPVDSKKEEKPK